jgi:hypothetical protein
LELGESFAQPAMRLVWSLPTAADAGRSRGHRIGAWEATEATRSRVHGSVHPSTRSRLISLSVAIWEGFPLYRLLHAGPAGNRCREGDKSEEAVPRQRLTFNPLQVFRREIESTQGRRIPSGDPIRRPENLRKFHLPGVFAFLGRRNQLIQCYPTGQIELIDSKRVYFLRTWESS